MPRILILPNVEELDILSGQVTLGEGLRLAYLAQAVREGVIVELGSFKGKSTCFLAAGSKAGNRVSVYAIDAWTLGPKSGKMPYADAETVKIFERQTLSYKDLIKPIKGLSKEVGKTWNLPIGLLFIDTVPHNYETCLSDYNFFSPHIVKGGHVAFHDWHLRGVTAVIEKVQKDEGWTAWLQYERLMTARRL